MKLANKSAYPLSLAHSERSGEFKDNQDYDNSGMTSGLTFRERLIVALASNPFFFSKDRTYEDDAGGIISQSDAIIKQLEEENK